MLLIVGKNSRLVKSVLPLLSVPFEVCSHRDLPDIDFAQYDRVLVFSWCHKSLTQNLFLLQMLPLQKTTFVSTVAVNALYFRRQISKYPSSKAFAESYVLNAGGNVLRLGVFEHETTMDHFAHQVLTTLFDLAFYINNILKDNGKSEVITLGKVGKTPVSASVGRSILIRSIAYLSYKFPPFFVIQAPLQLFIRKMSSSYYGYTGDSQHYCADTVVVGTGYIAAEVSKYLSPCAIFIQGNLDDHRLVEYGFNATLLGYYKKGITKFWHGVVIKFIKGAFIKTVPIFVDRPKIKNKTCTRFISKISQHDSILTLGGVADNSEILCNKCIVAAGTIETAKLVKPLVNLNIDLYFDDHEIGCAGTISLSEAERHGFIQGTSFLPIMFRGKVKRVKIGQSRILLDARPLIKNVNTATTNDIYSNRVSTIIVKLMRRFSLELINNAFFNKFGVSFKTRSIEIHYQIEVRDCIKLTVDNRLIRYRLQPNFFLKFENALKNFYPSYMPAEEWSSNDAQHVVGGKNCDKLFNVAKAQNIFAVSLLPGFRLFEMHHTLRYARHVGKFMSTFK